MKLKYKIIIALSILIGISAITYANVTGDIKWIYNTSTSDRFTGPTTIDGVEAYTDTYTGLKWQAYDSDKDGKDAETGSGPGKLAWAEGCETNNDNNKHCELYTATWNGTIYDYSFPSGGSENDFKAHKYCESLGGSWRLPTKNEMFSIMVDTKDERHGNTYYTALPSITNSNYWSSTASANRTNYAWYGDFGYGYVSARTKDTTSRYTICTHN